MKPFNEIGMQKHGGDVVVAGTFHGADVVIVGTFNCGLSWEILLKPSSTPMPNLVTLPEPDGEFTVDDMRALADPEVADNCRAGRTE